MRNHDVEEETHPPTLALPPPIHTISTPERTTTLNTHCDETVVSKTIFETLRLTQPTDEGKKSNILVEVFDEYTTIEQCNFQQVLYDNKNEYDDFAELQITCYATYYRQNPDNNKKNFKSLGLKAVENKC